MKKSSFIATTVSLLLLTGCSTSPSSAMSNLSRNTTKTVSTSNSAVHFFAPHISFLPPLKTTFYYNNHTSEHFVFSSNGYTESIIKSSAWTVPKVYYEDRTGLYAVDTDGFTGDKNVIPMMKNRHKYLILKYPLFVGQSWKDMAVSFHVISTTATVHTSLGTFHNTVEVKSDDNMTFWYVPRIGEVKRTVPGISTYEIVKIKAG